MGETWYEDIRDQAMDDRPAAAMAQDFLLNIWHRSSRISRNGEERVHGTFPKELCQVKSNGNSLHACGDTKKTGCSWKICFIAVGI
jgi:hypothetical protein